MRVVMFSDQINLLTPEADLKDEGKATPLEMILSEQKFIYLGMLREINYLII